MLQGIRKSPHQLLVAIFQLCLALPQSLQQKYYRNDCGFFFVTLKYRATSEDILVMLPLLYLYSAGNNALGVHKDATVCAVSRYQSDR